MIYAKTLSNSDGPQTVRHTLIITPKPQAPLIPKPITYYSLKPCFICYSQSWTLGGATASPCAGFLGVETDFGAVKAGR